MADNVIRIPLTTEKPKYIGDHTMTTKSECKIESDGRDLFVIFNGVKIAKRGHPDTPQAGQWVSLEPGYKVYGGTGDELVIERNGTRLQ